MNKIQNAAASKNVAVANTHTLRAEAQENGIGLLNGSYVSTLISVEGLRQSIALLARRSELALEDAVVTLIGRGVLTHRVRYSAAAGAVVFGDGSLVHESIITTSVLSAREWATQVLAHATLKTIVRSGLAVEGYCYADSAFTADSLFERRTKYSTFVYVLNNKLIIDNLEHAKNCYNNVSDLIVCNGDATHSDATALLDDMSRGGGEGEGDGESKQERRNRQRREARARARA